MKKVLVIISILAVFAILGLSISTAPIFNSNTDVSLGLKDFDELSPEVQALIDKDVEEALANKETNEDVAEETPTQNEEAVVETSNIEAQSMALGGSILCEDITCSYEPRGDGLYITKYTAVSGDEPQLIIPDSPTTKIVGIAEGAFKGLKKLKTVDLSHSAIKKIGMSAFYGCTSLTDVTFPDTLEEVGGYAFINTPWLKTQRAEANQSSLKNRLVIVKGILIDGIAAEGEVNIDYANGISKISPYAFSYNSKMTKLTITGINEVPYRLCSSATGLQELVTETNVIHIAPFSFFDCSALTKVTMSDVSIVDRAAFYECNKLATITFGNSLTKINNNAFMNCYGLTELTFPASLESIDVSGFLNCSSLRTLMFNKSEGSIDLAQGAFQNCTRLDAVTIDPLDSQLLNIKTNGATFNYPDGSKKITFFNTKVEIP